MNCWVVPEATAGLAGVTAMETNAGGLTVSVVDPLTPPEAAVIVVAPVATVVTNPAVLTMATLVADEVQFAALRVTAVPLL